MKNKNPSPSFIIPLFKSANETSFASLSTIKRALSTKEVGHTGTLDKFATGLLVVCTGRLTKLSSLITASDKAYEAIIIFGKESDTLDVTGRVVRESSLPSESDFFTAFEKLKGEYLQLPPLYSRISVGGVRSSEAARRGEKVTLQARKVAIKKSRVKNLFVRSGKVEAVHLELEVSKGTYIRSYARDLAALCKSAAYVAALNRIRLGTFRVTDALFYPPAFYFSIESAPRLEEANGETFEEYTQEEVKKPTNKEEIFSFARKMDEKLALDLGMGILHLKAESEKKFFNGQKITREFFEDFDCHSLLKNTAVFSSSHNFMGVIKIQDGKLCYAFVISQD